MRVRRNAKGKEKPKNITKNRFKRNARRMKKTTRRHMRKKTTEKQNCALGDANPANRTRIKVVSPRSNRISGQKRSAKNALKTKLRTIARNMPNRSGEGWSKRTGRLNKRRQNVKRPCGHVGRVKKREAKTTSLRSN